MYDPQEDELRKQILLRSVIGDNPSYGKPMIGNEQTAGVARGLSNAADLFVGRKPQYPVGGNTKLAEAMALANYKDGLKSDPLEIERQKQAQEQATYDAALKGEGQSYGPSVPTTNSMPTSQGPSMPTSMPQTAGNQQYISITDPPTREYDSKVGRFIEKPGKVHMEKNQDYVTPADQQANDEKSQMVKDSAQQNLNSIKEIKKGSRFFGPMGDLPSQYAPSSLPVVGGLTMGEPKLKGEYSDRASWEANINQLLSRKVVDLITQMKSASKTGATGFGQLSDKEGAILQQASTALNKRLPAEQAMKYLDEIEKINQRILNGSQATGGNQVGKYSFD